MKKVKLYTTHCPKCNILKKKLEMKNIEFEEIEDQDLMIQKGFSSVPMIETEDGNIMNYKEAVDWINSL